MCFQDACSFPDGSYMMFEVSVQHRWVLCCAALCCTLLCFVARAYCGWWCGSLMYLTANVTAAMYRIVRVEIVRICWVCAT